MFVGDSLIPFSRNPIKILRTQTHTKCALVILSDNSSSRKTQSLESENVKHQVIELDIRLSLKFCVFFPSFLAIHLSTLCAFVYNSQILALGKPSLHSMRSVLVFLENLPRWLIWFFNVHVLLCAVAIILSLSLLIVHTERPTYEQHKKRHAFYPIKWLLRASTIAYKFIWKLFVWFHFHEVMKLNCTLRCVFCSFGSFQFGNSMRYGAVRYGIVRFDQVNVSIIHSELFPVIIFPFLFGFTSFHLMPRLILSK